MSKEGTHSPVTPDKIEPARRNISNVAAESSVSPSNGRSSTRAFHHRASVGSFTAGNRATRDSSTGKSGSSNTSQTVIFQYLRASTGSCHDFCKYGMKHSPKEKPRTPQRKRHVKNLPVESNPVQTMVTDEGKNVKVFTHKPRSDAKTLPSYLKPPSDTKFHSRRGKAVNHKASTNPTTELQKLKTSSDEKTSFPRQNKAPTPKNKAVSTKGISSPDPPEMIKSVFFPSGNAEAKAGQCSLAACEMPRSGKKMIYPSSQGSSLKSIKVKQVLSSDSDVACGKERKNSCAETGGNVVALKASAKKISPPLAASLSPKLSRDKTASNRSRKTGNLKSVSSRKVQNQVGGDNSKTYNDEKVLEKTLHVIETAAENNGDSIPDDCAVSSFPSPSSPRSWSHAESSSLPSHEENNNKSGSGDGEGGKHNYDNDKSLETSSILFIPNCLDVLSVPSSPKALYHAESPWLLSHEEEDEEIDHSNDDPDKCILDTDESLEIATVQSVPVDPAITSFLPPLSAESPSLAESSSSSPHGEGKKEIKCLDGDAGESIPDDDESLEIGNMQLDPVVPTISSFPSPSSPESLSHAESSSSSPHEEDSKEIDYDEGQWHEYISENDESPEIGYVQSSLSLCSSLSSHEEDNEEIEYSDSNNGSAENGNVPPAAKENHKTTPRKSRVVIPEDTHSSPAKLKFKPGRVIDLQPDNSGPRRLRFRRGRDLRAEREHRQGESRALKRSGANSIVAAEEASSEKVVLKHQGVKDKKEPQVLLFNNVIEETAIKLVESRKSKVKALVGAFETVISLQESKPSF